MKASDFKIVQAGDSNQLAADLRQHFAQGWELYGFPFTNGAGWLAQAVAKPPQTVQNVPADISYVEGKSIGDITLKVEQHLNEEWTPIGGLTVVAIEGGLRYFQMMSRAKRVNEEKKDE
jgi:hypothetical protein